jgi:hypothetical protein
MFGEDKIILPHYKSDATYPIYDMMKNGEIEAVIAEVSHSATGQGIDLGWAYCFGVKVYGFYKSEAKVSGSIKYLFPNLYAYDEPAQINDILKEIKLTV